MALKMRRSGPVQPSPGCPMAACMAVLGGAWTTSVIWKLSGNRRRFGELEKAIPGISPKMLAARLRTLEAKGVVIREVVPSSPPSTEYSLSALGRELVPVIDSIVRVGAKLRQLSPPAAARVRRHA